MELMTSLWLIFAHLQVSGVQSDALFILLVEKDAAFMRLAEDRFYNTHPCIIITAKGQPDVATR
jgi:meiotic recombination protein SPO11